MDGAVLRVRLSGEAHGVGAYEVDGELVLRAGRETGRPRLDALGEVAASRSTSAGMVK